MKPRKTPPTKGLVGIAMHVLFASLRSFFMSPVAVGPHLSCGPFEQVRIYVEVIPRDLTHIVREPHHNISSRCGLINDTRGYQSIHDAILDAEIVGASVAMDVKPQNLLLVFGETVQSLRDALKQLPLPPQAFDAANYDTAYGYKQQDNRRKEKNPENRAIILCKLSQSERPTESVAGKKQHPSYKSNRYEIAWSELEEFKKWLEEVEHLNSLANSLVLQRVAFTLEQPPVV
jgi:hypothetical protein